jgi:spermidine synthase
VSPIEEPLAPGLRRLWEVSEVLADARTAYQHVVLARTAQGVGLFCDDERQSTEHSQLVYHEALLVPALLLASQLDRVLVVGSGEGVVSQLAVAAGARWVDHVDIDREAVELCARHLPYGYTPEELRTAEQGNGPVRVHYADGWDFLEHAARSAHRYDVVVVDLPDERPGPAQHNRLYQAEFLAACRSVLAPGGVVTSQAGCPTLWRNRTLLGAWQRFHEVFPTVVYFGSTEHEWAFLTGLTEPLPDPAATMTERLATLPYQPESIDAPTLQAATVAPHTLRRLTQ